MRDDPLGDPRADLLGLATGDDDTVQECAAVWAEAVARRDGTEPDVRRAAGGVRGRLRGRGADLLVVQRDGAVMGFVTMAPQHDGLELFHLATTPAAWGDGVAGRLLTAVESLATARRVSRLLLWVLDDNARARALYEQHGWVTTGETRTADDGRTEQRYVRTLPRP